MSSWSLIFGLLGGSAVQSSPVISSPRESRSAWGSCAYSYPTSWSGDAQNPHVVTDSIWSSTIGSYAGACSSTEFGDYFASQLWTDFDEGDGTGTKTAPWMVLGPFQWWSSPDDWTRLYVTWSGIALPQNEDAHVTLKIEYRTPKAGTGWLGYSRWIPLLANSFTKGRHTTLGGTEMALLRGGLEWYRSAGLEVKATLHIQRRCPESVGSYGGTLKIREIKLC